jgi:Tfp pilus assembly protein PilX
MRFLRKTVILGLAGLGAYRVWELLSPKFDMARDQAMQAKDRIEPALRDAKHSVEDATRDAASSLADASKEAAGSVADAASSAVDSARQPSNTPDAPGTSDEWSSPARPFGTVQP